MPDEKQFADLQEIFPTLLLFGDARARRMADTWAQHWNTSPKRLLSWAVAHCALSITWGWDGDEQTHLNLLDMLCGVLDGC